ncbi:MULTISPECIES: methyl-accepting chemotaxis protein [Halomonadaceae]|uniref:methyl-accepting chemotaxis protein n=1 Tax=Halomonadaceae TaxID=28256 RepID=UPI0015822715|nr:MULTISPECIES: methyl-accepting chemotaxis protein [Halomonas]MDI4637782.1 methyl-accepting chemotaxis protein [Halomonas sp. BMC7]NUJ58802.1 HAMP domain-containing protein [Halomonas taeanensis]|tara:strand:+ start:6438 stop:7739 length:1302 start_codon:yes stop_codon:yes gene_type:complete
MKLIDNMTVRMSWGLVLVTFTSLILVLSALGLYAVSDLGAVADKAQLVELGIFVVLGVTFITIALVLWGVTVNVIRPLERAVGHFERMAKGDLSGVVEQRGDNEIGRLFAAMDHMQQSLARTVGKVRQGGQVIHRHAQEISLGNTDLSSRTEQQAASLQETASSMEELTSTVSQNADNARQASQLAVDASHTARRGGEVVSEVVGTMRGINDSSHQVSEIIKVIDSIAFQTNILALNASVEAARAGEHGRGFAVVAEEVRNLAGRSSGASKEIRSLIEASVARVTEGTALVDRAGQTMEAIVSAVQRVSDIMDEIAAASQEQSNGIGQVNQAVTQMDQVTQQNAVLVEQAANAASELEREAEQLRTAVATFRLGSQASESAPAFRTDTATAHHRHDDDAELARWMPQLIGKSDQPSSRASRSSASPDDDWSSF